MTNNSSRKSMIIMASIVEPCYSSQPWTKNSDSEYHEKDGCLTAVLRAKSRYKGASSSGSLHLMACLYCEHYFCVKEVPKTQLFGNASAIVFSPIQVCIKPSRLLGCNVQVFNIVFRKTLYFLIVCRRNPIEDILKGHQKKEKKKLQFIGMSS